MKTMRKALMILAAFLAVAVTGFSVEAGTPGKAVDISADLALGSDNSWCDGNWFDTECYGCEGDDVADQVEAQDELYKVAAYENGDLVLAEHYALRSWVKANYALELGRLALVKGNYDEADKHTRRALHLGRHAQKVEAGWIKRQTALPEDALQQAELKRATDALAQAQLVTDRAQAQLKKVKAKKK